MTTPTTESGSTKMMTLPELRKFEGQLFVMNNTPNFMTFHEALGDKRVDFELQPAGGWTPSGSCPSSPLTCAACRSCG